MEKVRIGFIGCGGFSTGAVYPALHHAPVDLVAVCDLNENLAKRNAKWFGADRIYVVYEVNPSSQIGIRCTTKRNLTLSSS